MNINDLSEFNVVDREKRKLIDEVLFPHEKMQAFKSLKKMQ